MIEMKELTALLLCAGLSRRYGADDKLLAPVVGKPLLLHAATLIGALPVRRRIAVIQQMLPDAGIRKMLHPLGFELVENPYPVTGRDSSLRLGLAKALEDDCSAILVALGDMPSITVAQVEALREAAGSNRAAVSSCEDWWSPPLILPRAIAEQALLQPNMAVRTLLDTSEMRKVPATREILVDLDTPQDFSELEMRITSTGGQRRQ